jgi:hypothetical protein
MAVETLVTQTARAGADAQETDETRLCLVDGVPSQERMREDCKMPHLSTNDAAIERVAWLIVLGLLLGAIWLAGML